jgi:hypothetical protein
VSAYSRSGHFLAASVFAEAVWRYRVLRLRFWVMDHATLGCGGGILCKRTWGGQRQLVALEPQADMHVPDDQTGTDSQNWYDY